MRASRAASLLAFAPLVWACDEPPSPATWPPAAVSAVSCVRGSSGSVGVVLCDMDGNAEAYRQFLLGNLVPPRERKLRRSSALRFGLGAEVPIDARNLGALTQGGSYLAAFDDREAQRDIAGWSLLDRTKHLAMLLLGVDDRLGIIITEFPAASIDHATSALRSFDLDLSVAELSHALSGRVQFSLPAPDSQ
jgi:hypothetical protein